MVEDARRGGRLISVPGDISKPETAQKLIEETVKAFGKLDIFMSNADVLQTFCSMFEILI